MFDIDGVCYVTLHSDIDDMRARMYNECRKPLLVLSGVLLRLGIIWNHSCISNKGLQEIEWVISATSERWKHACEDLEPQVFLVA